MSAKKDFRPIYEHLFRHCAPFCHDGPWQELIAPGDIRRAPEEPAEVINDLRQQFSDIDLQEAGVCRMDETLAVQLDPALCDPDAVVIALRRKPKDDPFDVMTEHGMLSGKHLPVCASLSDGSVRAMISKTQEKILLATLSPIDVAVLLSLKIPATLATGLRQLEGVYLQQVRKRFDLRKTPHAGGIIDQAEEMQKKGNQSPSLVLTGCSLAEMSCEEPTNGSAIVSHLSHVERYLDVPLDRFYIWRPTETEMRTIEFRMKYVGPTDTRAAILGSIENSTGQLIEPAGPLDGLPKDLPTAIRQLAQHRGPSTNDPMWDWGRPYREMLRKKDEEWVQKAWENIQRLIGKSCIDSMLKRAQSSEDVVERNLWMIAGLNGQVSYSQAMQMLLTAIRVAKDSRPGKPMVFPEVEFRQWMDTIDRELKVLKEIRECRQSPFRRWKRRLS